jgi:hypothetical protein
VPAKPDESAARAPRSWTEPEWKRRQRWLAATRLWAFLKIVSLAYTIWWLLGYAHARTGTRLCIYGFMCLLVGMVGHLPSLHWPLRFFGPGQKLEPELYEYVGKWFYRLGVVLVVCGGVLALVQGGLTLQVHLPAGQPSGTTGTLAPSVSVAPRPGARVAHTSGTTRSAAPYDRSYRSGSLDEPQNLSAGGGAGQEVPPHR